VKAYESDWENVPNSPLMTPAKSALSIEGRKKLRAHGIVGFANGAFVYDKSAASAQRLAPSAPGSKAHLGTARAMPDATKSEIERSWDTAAERLMS
jgi:hypothetical protein